MLEAFKLLHLSLCKYCVLNVPLSDDVYELHTDASGLGVGCVLNVCRRGETLPVAFSPAARDRAPLFCYRVGGSTTSCMGGNLLLSLTTSH